MSIAASRTRPIVPDDAWAPVAPYPTLPPEGAGRQGPTGQSAGPLVPGRGHAAPGQVRDDRHLPPALDLPPATGTAGGDPTVGRSGRGHEAGHAPTFRPDPLTGVVRLGRPRGSAAPTPGAC